MADGGGGEGSDAAHVDSNPSGTPEEDNEEVVIEELDEPDVDSGDDAQGGDDLGDENTEAGQDREMKRVEKHKKKLSAAEKLAIGLEYKDKGNQVFKGGEIFKAADAYYHAILYCRELQGKPEHYPDLGHNAHMQKVAREMCESCFLNLALVQNRHAATLPDDSEEKAKVLAEAARSAAEALKFNAKNVKALYRRGVANSALARGPNKGIAEAQALLAGAKADLRAAAEEDPKNKDVRTELASVLDRLKGLKRDEVAAEKKQFSFGNTLGGLAAKERDLVADRSIRKRIETVGDGGKWLNEEWLQPDSQQKCVATIACALISHGGADGCQTTPSPARAAVRASFVVGGSEMHEGIDVAARSMTLGETAMVVVAPCRTEAKGAVADLLQAPSSEWTVWQVTLDNVVTWADPGRDGRQLVKIHDEGWGRFPQPLSDIAVHWRVHGPDGALVHSSRYTIDLSNMGLGGMAQVEDDDKEAPWYVMGDECWEPLVVLARQLRQGGLGEVRMRRLPPLPKDAAGPGDSTSNASAQLSAMLSKQNGNARLEHCTVRAELVKVVLPITGPGDARWAGLQTLVEERFRAEVLADRGDACGAVLRLRRVVDWSRELPEGDAAATFREAATARASLGWLLASRAAPVLDSGNVTSSALATARRELAEAEEHCAWLEEHCTMLAAAGAPVAAAARLLRAKLLVATDDDFAGAHAHLVAAQGMVPDDKRVQEELRKVKVELRREGEEKSRVAVAVLRDELVAARKKRGACGDDQAVISLLGRLADTWMSWDTVMESRIGVELKACKDSSGAEVGGMCDEILARLKDESKEQRPMW